MSEGPRPGEVELRKLLDHVNKWAEAQFARNGEVPMTWHAVTGDGEMMVQGVPVADRDLAAAMIRALFYLHDVQRYVMVTEAWTTGRMLSAEEAETARRQGLEHLPGRLEILLLSGEDQAAGLLTYQREIIRPPKGKPHFGPLVDTAQYAKSLAPGTGRLDPEVEGRLIGMLPHKGTKQ